MFCLIVFNHQVGLLKKEFSIKVVVVQSPASRILTLCVQAGNNIDHIKGQIQAIHGTPPYQQRILMGGKQYDKGTLYEHNINEDSVLRVVSPS